MYRSVKKVIIRDNYCLELIFDTNENKLIDMKPYLKKGMFRELKKPEIFNSAHISFDTVEWSNGLDICPEFLYKNSKSINK